MSNPTCRTCRTRVEIPHLPDAVECRRYPPTLMLLPAMQPSIANPTAQAGMTLTAMHPQLSADHYCGEHAPELHK